MNEQQIKFLELWLEKNVFTVKEEGWGDAVCVHASDVEKVYKLLKSLE